jgi:hypothetical protein
MFRAALLPLDVWRPGGLVASRRCVAPQSLIRCAIMPAGVAKFAALEAEAQVARIAWLSRGVGAVRLLGGAGPEVWCWRDRAVKRDWS